MSWERFTFGIEKTPPCKECTERYLGCHGKCEKYLAYKERIAGIAESRDEYIKAHVPTSKYAKQTNKRKKGI